MKVNFCDVMQSHLVPNYVRLWSLLVLVENLMKHTTYNHQAQVPLKASTRPQTKPLINLAMATRTFPPPGALLHVHCPFHIAPEGG